MNKRWLLSAALVAAVVGLLGAALGVVMAVVQLIDSFEYERGLDASPGTNRARAAALAGAAVVAAFAARALLRWRGRQSAEETQA